MDLGEQWRSWLRYFATRQKVPGSIPVTFLRNFQVTYSFCRHSVDLASTLPLKAKRTNHKNLEKTLSQCHFVD